MSFSNLSKKLYVATLRGCSIQSDEFDYFLNAFGYKVTLIEMLPKILPVEDVEISDAVHKSFVKQGIDCRVNTRVDSVEVGKKSVEITLGSGLVSVHFEGMF